MRSVQLGGRVFFTLIAPASSVHLDNTSLPSRHLGKGFLVCESLSTLISWMFHRRLLLAGSLRTLDTVPQRGTREVF